MGLKWNLNYGYDSAAACLNPAAIQHHFSLLPSRPRHTPDFY